MFGPVEQKLATVLGTSYRNSGGGIRSSRRSSSSSLRKFPTTTAITATTRQRNYSQLESKSLYQQQQVNQQQVNQQQQQIQQIQYIQQHRRQQHNNNYTTSITTTTTTATNSIQKRGMMMMARSSVEKPKNSDSKAMTFLIATLGYDEKIAQGVISALKQSGVSNDTALLGMVRMLAGRWEVDEDAGLEALVESVTLELARSENKQLIKFWIVPSSGWPSKEGDDDYDNTNKDKDGKTDLSRAVLVEGYEDLSLTDVAKFGDGDGAQVLGEMIECACSGIMACSTCHIVVADEWFEKVGEPSEDELDMIDLAYNPKRTSRLACRVILTPELNNAIFKMPLGANNMMDFIPFEDV